MDKCLTAALHDNMDISRIQDHARNLEESQQPQRGERELDRGYHKRDRSSGPIGDSGQARPPTPRCSKCRKLHWGQCRLGSDVCYTYGRPGYIMRERPSIGGSGRVQLLGSAAGSSSSIRPPGQGSQMPVSRGRGKEGAPSSSGPQHRIYAWGWVTGS
ncbi:uncharacterized protein LOC132046186 [Lycium ferocissimum]|uniref:uncharacterized protein LOC132046186 n=1 Tax=Lycium ferocissimum TaxID=112874 RepID=UPI0028162CD3|nr:uncharacterized protein LOC132046186 [Lycium ferocissimum]